MLSVITDPAELEALRGEWSNLWRNDPRATPFQSPEWLLPWWKHLFQGGQLWTIVQRRDSALCSLLPLFRFGERREHLAFIGTGVSDYLDLLGEPVPFIPGDWEDGCLEELRPGSPLLSLHAFEACSVCPVTTLPASMKDLVPRLDSKLAVDIHRSSNRLRRAGSVRIERTTSLEDLFRLHRARWEERNEEGMVAEQRLQDFHREVAKGFEKLGILRIYCLWLDDKPAAMIYAFTHRERTYAYLSGFDPALSKLSPGVVLLAYAIEAAIEEGVREFDFLRNPEPYKYKWAAFDQPTYKLTLVRPGPDRSSLDRSPTQ